MTQWVFSSATFLQIRQSLPHLITLRIIYSFSVDIIGNPHSSIFDSKLTGIEQSLHSYGRGKVKTAMLSRLTAGLVKGSIIICLPGSPGAAKDALSVLIPTIFHSFHMMKGEQH